MGTIIGHLCAAGQEIRRAWLQNAPRKRGG
jgi:hypothetical protein